MTIAIDENIPLLADALAPCGAVRTFAAHELTSGDLRDVDALVVRSKTRVDAALLHAAPVRFVGTATAGTDHIDSAYLRERGTYTAHAAGCNAMSVAEYVLYASLYWGDMLQQKMQGKTVGIIGFGNVGKRVAALARHLSMRVLLHDPPLVQQGFSFPADCQHVDIATLVATADIVALHVPLVRQGQFSTAGLLSPTLLPQMRKGALLVQASRGGVACEHTVLSLLRSKHIHAAFDVWESEPLANIDLVQHCLLATPHIAGYSWEGKVRGSAMMAQAFASWSGLQPNMEVFAAQHSGGNHAALHDEAALFQLLRHNRCLHDDDRDFRATLSASAPERTQRFHALRKLYPLRHESLPDTW